MGRQKTLQTLSLVVLLSLAACCAAAKPHQGLAASNGQLAAITPQGLRALDTSFSRLVENALSSDEQQPAGNIAVASANDASEEWVANYYKPKKSTLGEWFQNLIAKMDADYEIEKREDAYKRSRDHQEHADHEQYHDTAAADDEQIEQRYDYDKWPGKDGKQPQYWLLDEDDQKHDSKEGPHKSYRSEHHDSKQKHYGFDHKQYSHEQYSEPKQMALSAPVREHYSEPEHRQYEEEQHGLGHKEEQHGPDHGPHNDHEQYDGPDHRQYEEEQHGLGHKEEQHGPDHGPHKHSEEVCVQEVSKSSCSSSTVTGNTNSVHYTSSLSCCHSTQGDRYYAEPSYPSEPEYPAYAAMMIRRHREGAELERVPPAKGPSARTQLFDSPFDSPHRFYPRGGKAECQWSVAYHDAVVVDESTKQIGIASATCHFNGSMEHCGSPLCEGLTITVSADVYSTYAVSKYPPATPALDASCNTIFNPRTGQKTTSKQIIPTAGLIGGPGLSQHLGPGRNSERPQLSDSLATGAQRPLAGQVPHAAQIAPRPTSMSDLLVNTISNPTQKQQQHQPQFNPRAGQQPSAPAVKSVSDLLVHNVAKGQPKPARRSQGIRSHIGMGAHTVPDMPAQQPEVPAATKPTPTAEPVTSAPVPSQAAETKPVAEPQPKQDPAPKPEAKAAEPQPAAKEPAAEPKPAAAAPAPLKAEDPKPAAADPAPVKAADPAPVKAADPAPVKAAEPAPGKAADPAPVKAAEPAPVKAAEPAPVKAADPAPVKAAEPAPVKAADPAPVKAAEPAPVKAADPAPVMAADPAPVKAAEPAPVKAADPAPVKAADPAPVKAADPAPVKAAEPAPVKAADPAPVKAADPAAVKAADPAPVKAAEPAPVKAAEPKPTTQEPAVSKPALAEPAPLHLRALKAAELKLAEAAKVGVANIVTNQFMIEPQAHYAGRDNHRDEHDERERHEREHYDDRNERPRYGREDHYERDDLADSILDHTQDSGYYGGEAIVIAGVVTSVKGLDKGMDFERGMLEHVTSFAGVPLSKKAYEALPVDTPHIKHGAYKIVFLGDDERHY